MDEKDKPPVRRLTEQDAFNEYSAQIAAHTFLIEILLAHVLKDMTHSQWEEFRKTIDESFEKGDHIPEAIGPIDAVNISDIATRHREIVAEVLKQAEGRINRPR